MSAAAPTRVEERPAPFVARADLVVRTMASRVGTTWVVKDPVANRYFQLGAEEGWLLRQLDGQRSYAQLCREFNDEFAPRRIDTARLEALLRRLREDHLLLAPGGDQAHTLWEEGQRRARRERLFAWLQPWAIRFRGVDPTRFVEATYPYVRPLFTPAAAWLAAALVVSALVLAVARFHMLTAKLPPLETYLRWQNVAWLVVALSIVKVLHELGHAYTSRHFGVRCHELGVMLLAGVPCLYCNVTDAWLLQDKRQRAAIGAAGIVVELVIASIALWLWWASAPGTLNTLCFHLLAVCSIGTLVFNGNPLLRYDGYYVLSDLLALPNMRDEAIARVEEKVLEWFTATPPRTFASIGMPRWLPWFGAASLAYGVAVLLGLAWVCYQLLEPWGGGPFVLTLAAVCMVGTAAPSVRRIARAARFESLSGEPVLRRFLWRGGIFTVLLAIVLFVPLPRRVRAPGVIVPRESRQLYVLVEGQLDRALPAGSFVKQGETVVWLTNHRLAREVATLEGEANVRRQRVAHLGQLSVADQDASLRLPAAQEALADTEERLRVRRLEFDRLQIKSPLNGTLLPSEAAEPMTGRDELPTWSGSPLDEVNRGATLLPETVVGVVADISRLDVVLACDEDDISQLAEGQTAVVVSDQAPGTSLAARVTEINPLDMETAPRALSDRGLVPTRQDGGANGATPLRTLYQVRLELLDATTAGTPLGGAAQASVQVPPRSIAWRVGRFLARTFGNVPAR
jgi:putative peptide zinc metalloprotease protein